MGSRKRRSSKRKQRSSKATKTRETETESADAPMLRTPASSSLMESMESYLMWCFLTPTDGVDTEALLHVTNELDRSFLGRRSKIDQYQKFALSADPKAVDAMQARDKQLVSSPQDHADPYLAYPDDEDPPPLRRSVTPQSHETLALSRTSSDSTVVSSNTIKATEERRSYWSSVADCGGYGTSF